LAGGRARGENGFLPDRLRAARTDKQMTLAEVGRAAGVSASTISQYESGRRVPELERVGRLARAVGLKPADLTEIAEDERGTLIELRKAAALKQAAVAEMSGISRSWYSWLERGEAESIKDAECAALAEVFGVTAAEVRIAHAAGRAAFVHRSSRR
jgi:transcriptional regulator with XRE-family HTH domain